MPALSYKAQFVDRVANGSKPHSIRAWRRRPFKVGDVLMHYTAMRTKQCRKIRPDTLCLAAVPVEVNAHRRYVILSEGSTIYSSGRLSTHSLKVLARMDGFASLEAFWQFFRDAHGGLLCGQLVEWNPFQPAPVPAPENGEPAKGRKRAPLAPVRSSPARAGKSEPRGRRLSAPAAIPQSHGTKKPGDF